MATSEWTRRGCCWIVAEMHRQPGDAAPSSDYQQPWQERVNQLPAFRLSSAVLADGEIHLRNIPGQDGADIRIDRLNLSVRNVTNSINVAPSLMATVSCKARVMSNGSLEFRADGYPFALSPTFNADFQTSNIDARRLQFQVIEDGLCVSTNLAIGGRRS